MSLRCLYLTGALATLLFATAAQAADRELSLSLSAADPTIKSGAPLLLKIDVINQSASMQRLAFILGDPKLGFRIHIKDRDGNPVSELLSSRQRDKEIHTQDIGSVVGTDIKPGDRISKQVTLNGQYDLAPGQYLISVDTSPIVFNGGTGHRADVPTRSNEIDIAVVP